MMLTRRIYFVDHNTHTTMWGDPRLPSTVDREALHYKCDCRRKIIYFWSQPAMRLIADAKCDVHVCRRSVFGTPSWQSCVSGRRISTSNL